MPRIKTITVAGVTFSSEQVKEVIIEVDGREVSISRNESEEEPERGGFGFNCMEETR